MLSIFLVVAAFAGPWITAPPAALAETATLSGPVCPPGTAQGRGLVDRYTSHDVYAVVRARYGVQRGAADTVRLLTDQKDADACRRLMEALQERARAAGGDLASSRPEFYEVSGYYYAPAPLPRSRCKRGPGHVCIDTRWQSMAIFSRDFKLIASVAI